MDKISSLRDPNLLGYFYFDGNSCRDKTGRVPSVSATGFGYVKKGLAKRIDSTYSEISLPVYRHLCPGKFVCRSRFQINSLVSASDGIFQCNENGTISGYFQGVNTSSNALSYVGAGAWNVCTGTSKIKVGKPQEMVTVYDGATHALYVDGVLAQRQACGTMAPGNTNCAFIGKYATYKINGCVESVEVFSDFKSDAEILQEYKQWMFVNSTPLNLSLYALTGNAIGLAPTGIGSGEVVTIPNVTASLLTALDLTGISSSESVGNPNLNLIVTATSPLGIPSEESFGTSNVKLMLQKLEVSGIPSEERVGGADVTLMLQTLEISGISSGETLGNPNVNTIEVLTLSGITSGEAFGTEDTKVGFILSTPSILSSEAFGTPSEWTVINGYLEETISYAKTNQGTVGIQGFLTEEIENVFTSSGLTGIIGYLEDKKIGFQVSFEGASVESVLNALAACLWTGANTEYTSYPFNSFCTTNTNVLAASSEGLFTLGGETDNGDPISSLIETPPDDFGISAMKNVMEVVVGIEGGPAQISYKVGPSRFPAQVLRSTDDLKNRRSVPGKGSSHRYWSTRITNDSGSHWTLDSIEYAIFSRKRKIGK